MSTEVVPLAGEDRPPVLVRRVLSLAWPVLCQQGLVFTVNFSDRLLVGRFLPDVAYQSAQTTASYLAWVISSYTIFVTVGSTALVARFVGAGDRQAAVRVTHQALLLAALLGVLGTALGLVFPHELVWLLDLRGTAADFAVAFLQPLFSLLTFQIVEMAGIACLIGAGDTRPGLWVLGGVAIINLPLAWLFYLGVGPLPGWGFQGISLGTGLSHVIGCLAVLTMLARGRSGLQLRPRLFRPNGDLLWRLVRISVPAGLDSMSLAAGQLVFLAIVNHLGDEAGSAHGIALHWEALAYLSGGAFGTAAMALVGQNLGAGRPDLAARCGWTTFGLGCAVMCGMGTVFFLLAPRMFALFCPQPEKHGVITAGVPVLQLVAFAMPALACTIIFTAALRGAGDTRVPLLFTWIGFLLVRIPLALLFTSDVVGLGLFGAWLAMFADLYVRGGFFLYRFVSGRWRKIQV